jgi:hypothetical protein
MCEADSLILHSFGVEGRVNRTFCDSDALSRFGAMVANLELHRTFLLESLILAQDERWRRA